ncbi:MAG: hypothetical protein MJ198_05060 [Bacteroidales bacterium]|nr:hypothetical protein [Bacteroidales bacterium]
MKDLGSKTQQDDIQTRDSVLNGLIQFFDFGNLETYGSAVVDLARQWYYDNGGKITSSGFLKDYIASDYKNAAYNKIVDRLEYGQMIAENTHGDVNDNKPCFYPFNQYELVQLSVDGKGDLCFLQGCYYMTLTASGIKKQKITTIQTSSIRGSLNGVFSVSLDQTILFSKGNLQYQPVSETWRFAEHQYDVVGGIDKEVSTDISGNVYETIDGTLTKCSNLNMHDETYQGWIDVFSYGCTGWNGGQQYYKPTESVLRVPGSATDGEGYFNNNLSGKRSDWGFECDIVNGGGRQHVWRTLKSSEWQYLFLNRRNQLDDSYLFTKVMIQLDEQTPDGVTEIAAVILFPDNFMRMPNGCENISAVHTIESTSNSLIFKCDVNFRDNEVTLEQIGLLETEGCVILPCCGVGSYNEKKSTRDDKLWYKNSATAFYVAYESASQNGNNANWLAIDDTNQLQFQGFTKNAALAVRLVCDIE